MKTNDLKTPAFVIILEKLKSNAGRMIKRAQERGIGLRPHVKTHKTVEIARMQVGDGPSMITVSTLAEARHFAEAGFEDITYAFPITPNKLEEAAEIAGKLKSLNLIVDHWAPASELLSFARTRGIRFPVFLKVDPGLNRAGVDPESKEGLMLAQQLHTDDSIDFKGILTHAGQAYMCKNREEIVNAAEQEREVMTTFADKLQKNGVPCPARSVGSTPTAVLGESWEGVTEIRPGNYVFFDRLQADIGTCSRDEWAMFVLATVSGHYPSRNAMLIDAGALALSKDPGAVHVRKEPTFGEVAGHPRLEIKSLSQEHGIIESRDPIKYNDFPIGSEIRIIPNHSCLAAALFSRYHVLDGDEVTGEWVPVRGW